MQDIIEFLSIVNWPGALIVAGAFLFLSVTIWRVL